MSTFSLSNTGSEINDAIAKVHSADITPTNASTNMVTSGGVHTAINNLDLTNLAGSSLVTESEGIAGNDNDNTIPTSAAVKSYVDDEANVAGTLRFSLSPALYSYGSITWSSATYGYSGDIKDWDVMVPSGYKVDSVVVYGYRFQVNVYAGQMDTNTITEIGSTQTFDGASYPTTSQAWTISLNQSSSGLTYVVVRLRTLTSNVGEYRGGYVNFSKA